MDIIKQILDSFSGTLPNDSKTAAAIARNASPEEISACATTRSRHRLCPDVIVRGWPLSTLARTRRYAFSCNCTRRIWPLSMFCTRVDGRRD